MRTFRVERMVLGMIRTNCYLLIREDTGETLIVDPADRADRIEAKLTEEHLTPCGVLLTHGHYYNVSTGPAYLKQEARERGFDIVMFGHTHRPYFDIDKSGEKELITLNPGSLSYPRQEGHRPSYMLMKIDDNGEARFEQHYL